MQLATRHRHGAREGARRSLPLHGAGSHRRLVRIAALAVAVGVAVGALLVPGAGPLHTVLVAVALAIAIGAGGGVAPGGTTGGPPSPS